MKAARLTFIAIAVAAAMPLLAATETFSVDPAHSNAGFKIRHLMSNVSGSFGTISGTLNLDRSNAAASSVQFTIDPSSINTANGDRDKHLRSADFFDVEKYPQITFRSTSIAPTKTKNLYDVTGDLTMHGVTKTVTLPVTFLGFGKDPWGNERAGFELETTINRKDFGINWNKALDQGGYLLDDDVKVSISLEAVNKKK